MTDSISSNDKDTKNDAPAQDVEYQVLARKYRPRNFDELKGQDALVRTLRNAIETGRLAHAFMLTGVRGIGKTTTARIIALALNCIGEDGKGGPTASPCGVCANCVAIAQDRHIDVLEMDAASRTGIDDIREIIESVQYAPSSARYKVYIIDEVHMLSKQAFNGLLKTLEEPPEHVKFILATTEIRKVPITVLSRCQRFDLRRFDHELLEEHFTEILGKENATAEPEAISLIAHAADGSARDGLSILDQAIAIENGKITEKSVREMLGLANRTIIFDLFESLISGEAEKCFKIMENLHEAGGDPLVILQDLMGLTHFLTKYKTAPETAKDGNLPEAERVRGCALADKLNIPILTRIWQILLKGTIEVQQASRPMQAAEMILVRILYAADLPNPADLMKQLKDGTVSSSAGASVPNNTTPAGGATASSAVASGTVTSNGGQSSPVARMSGNAQGNAQGLAIVSNGQVMAVAEGAIEEKEEQNTILQPETFAEMVELFGEMRQMVLQTQLKQNVHLVKFSIGHLEIRLAPNADKKLIGSISKKMLEWTKQRWVVSLSKEEGEPTIAEIEGKEWQEKIDTAKKNPVVAEVLKFFPKTDIVTIDIQNN